METTSYDNHCDVNDGYYSTNCCHLLSMLNYIICASALARYTNKMSVHAMNWAEVHNVLHTQLDLNGGSLAQAEG